MTCAFVLHVAPWRESSALVELIAADRGRVGAVARGARRARSRLCIQPFCELDADLGGRGELATLTRAEPVVHRWFTGNTLAAALYLNEVLMRVLVRGDPCDGIQSLYRGTLARLDGAAAGLEDAPETAIESALRAFEFGLLEELGYGVDLDALADGSPIESDGRYRYVSGVGLVRVTSADPGTSITGAGLAELAGTLAGARPWSPVTRMSARIIGRAALASLLGPAPLASRSLWRVRRDDSTAGG